MAKMIQVPYDFNVQVPISTAQAVQKDQEQSISLDALGLLVNLLSYPTTWELHKTELYKRFAQHGERSVKSAWNSLVDANYIIEFRYRVGKKWEYVYYFRKVPFSPEEKAGILDNAEKEYGEIWGLQNEDHKKETSKGRVNQKNILNTDIYKNKDINKDIDDDKRTSSPVHSEEELNTLISNFYEEVKYDLTDRSFKSVVRKVLDKYHQGKITSSFRDYLATALINKIEDLELRRIKDTAKQKIRTKTSEEISDRLNNLKVSDNIPFYNWLEDDE
jgi:hypothetical protein